MIDLNYLNWRLNRQLTDNEIKVIEILNNICIYGSEENEHILKDLILNLMLNNEIIQKEIIKLYPNKTEEEKEKIFLKLQIELENKIY